MDKQDTEVRQGQLTTAALQVIGRRGVSGLSVERIARLVGLAPSAMYRHFANKDELLDAVLAQIRDRLLANVAAASIETSDPLATLEALLMRHAVLVQENQGIPRLAFSEEVFNDHPDRKAMVRAILQAYLAQVAGIIQLGQRKHLIRGDIDAPTIALMLLGIVQPAAMAYQLSAGHFDVEAHTRKAWALLRESLIKG